MVYQIWRKWGHWEKIAENFDLNQGGQIGRIFAPWVIVNFGQIL
jgi:hypothetical protein